MDALNNRLKEINEGKEDFYQNIINKSKLDEMYKSFGASKQVEQLIYRVVSKMESMKGNHEESAYIFLKLKEMNEQQEKVATSIEDNSELLDTLKSNLDENVKLMKKNISHLKERLTKLKK
jgi:methyl-accepting chemotaxis protein